MNNVPTLEPETAAQLAKTLGVRVYAVAIGREGLVPFPVDDPIFGRRMRQIETHIDEELLRRIADTTGGEMFRATDPEALQHIFATIDELEKTRYQTHGQHLVPGADGLVRGARAWLLLLAEALLAATWLQEAAVRFAAQPLALARAVAAGALVRRSACGEARSRAGLRRLLGERAAEHVEGRHGRRCWAGTGSCCWPGCSGC